MSACRHFGICGGCAYSDIPYDEQLTKKSAQVEELLAPFLVDSNNAFEGIIPSPNIYGYRNKMEFTFGDEYKGGPLVLGLHKKKSFHDIVPVDDCNIADEDFRAIRSFTEDYFRKEGISYFHRMHHTGILRHLLIRKGQKTGEILVDLVTISFAPRFLPVANSDERTDIWEVIIGWAKGLIGLKVNGTITGILHTICNSVADIVRDQGTRILFGRNYYFDEIQGLKFKITPFSFFQTNTLGAEVMYKMVCDYLKADIAPCEYRTCRVYDLYCGTGTITQILAKTAARVTGVEIVPEAVAAAKENASLNGLPNCEFIVGDVLNVLDNMKDKPDVIVLDPPRDGVHAKALGKILDYNVETIIYISCKPTSLARDLVPIIERGYKLKKCVCVDMFPHTANVETVVLLSKKVPENELEAMALSDGYDLDRIEAAIRLNNEELLLRIIPQCTALARQRAVEALENPDRLAEIAKNDTDKNVRKAAVAKLKNEAVLLEIFETEKKEDVRMTAVSNLINNEEFLKSTFKRGCSNKMKSLILSGINDEIFLKRVAKHDPSAEIRLTAAEKIKDMDFIRYLAWHDEEDSNRTKLWDRIHNKNFQEIYENDTSPKVKLYALKGIDNQETLLKNALSERNAEPALAAYSKLKPPINYRLFASAATNSEVSLKAAMELNDENDFQELALNHPDRDVVFYACARIHDIEILKEIIDKRPGYKTLGGYFSRRLMDAAHRIKELEWLNEIGYYQDGITDMIPLTEHQKVQLNNILSQSYVRGYRYHTPALHLDEDLLELKRDALSLDEIYEFANYYNLSPQMFYELLIDDKEYDDWVAERKRLSQMDDSW
ncbi:MAG: 23S rRNA (uracil(1939)-C(5))-methyltransferase RlmD [Lachnospiraceae bacterium]|nr:23S rRNA (uracil(1939)-C(5))-methyltransferase RlmD [Lachnospiraceae bacterium]